MTGPQDPAAAGRDRLRAGHADREQVIDTLKTAFVHGRLTRDELGARAGQALAARTYADLAALTADIPPPPPASRGQAARRPPRPRWPLARAAARSGGCLIFAAAAMWVRSSSFRDGPRPQAPIMAWAPLTLLIAFSAVFGALGFMGARDGHLAGAAALPQAAAAPAGAGRPRPGRRTARRHRPWPGSPRPPHRPGPRRPAGSPVTAAPAAHSPRAGRASRGARPAPGAI